MLARRFFDRFEPVHAVTYFAPEARAAMDALGYRGFWMGYFAGRAAPLGRASAELVTAMFYNFSPAHVQRSLPGAWDIAAPEAALRARLESAVAALRRYGLDDGAEVATAADLAAKAAIAAAPDGRGLFAANAALPWPTAPLEKLWHATTLLREQRGDAHVAALVSVGVNGREANVLHCAAGGVPAAFIKRSRDYTDDEWRRCVDRLAGRGLLSAGGELTTAGAELKEHIEAVTDAVSLPVLDALTDDEVQTLFAVLTPITRAVVAGGDLPAATPMGLRRDELDDESAHLS